MHDTLDELAAAVAALLEVPIVLIRAAEDRAVSLEGAHGLTIGWRGRTDVGPAPCREVVATGRPVIVSDARQRLSEHARAGWGFDTGSYAGVPVLTRARMCVGSLAAIGTRPRAWQASELVALRGFAIAVGAAFEAHQLRRRCAELERNLQEERDAFEARARIAASTHRRITGELVAIAEHDELTGVLNRRGFFAAAEAQLAMMRQQRVTGFVLYIDIDELKRTNDARGHAVGDNLLRGAGHILRSALREGDTIGRLGGDEFAVLAAAPAAEPDAVHAVTSRIFAELDRWNARETVPIAWTVGTAPVEPDRPLSLDGLLIEADRAMYRSKPTRELRPARKADIAGGDGR